MPLASSTSIGAQRLDHPPEMERQAGAGAPCVFEDLGCIGYRQAWQAQRGWVERVKSGAAADRLLLAAHPPTITLGRNARRENVLAPERRLAELGIEICESDRGGDVTYHGPGQVVGYPILDLRRWKRDVGAYLRALEQVLIEALAEFGLRAGREQGLTGVWVEGAKIAAIGVHLSRWVSSHGFALNVTDEHEGFASIVPCGLSKPVTSIEEALGQAPPRQRVVDAVVRSFGRVFERRMIPAREEIWKGETKR